MRDLREGPGFCGNSESGQHQPLRDRRFPRPDAEIETCCSTKRHFVPEDRRLLERQGVRARQIVQIADADKLQEPRSCAISHFPAALLPLQLYEFPP